MKINTHDLLVARALCSLGDTASENSSANAQSRRESEKQELKTVPVQDKKK